MGYTAGAILHHLDDYHASLQKTTSNEMLVQACRLYLECEYVLIGLKVLAWFTFCITLPFLNMTEVSTQKDLVSILPCLHDDLLEKKTNTLSQYRVPYSFQLDEPESPIELYLLGEMCTQAGKDLAKQRGREYGFSDASTTDSDPRATELHKLQPSDLEGLPTNNLECERDLSKFDKLARRSAASSNRKFTAKGMRNDMTLNNAGVVTVEKMTRDIAKVMDKSEQEWVKSQKLLT